MSAVLATVGFAALFAAGAALAAGSLRRGRPLRELSGQRGTQHGTAGAPHTRRAGADRRAPGVPLLVAVPAVAAGGAAGYAATGLWGMALLLGGLGGLLPPFVAAPRRRRRQTREALAWALWTRQLAELARSGAGLTEALAASTGHAPAQLADTVRQVAATARTRGVAAALDRLAAAGTVWEPEVAAGLRIASDAGGPLAGPLLDLCSRIGDVVGLHRARTEAVVALWAQTIALLGLAGGVIVLMYRNNPAYFEPYRTPTGQLVLTLIATVLLGATAFLVRHSVVRTQPSPLAPPPRRQRGNDPL